MKKRTLLFFFLFTLFLSAQKKATVVKVTIDTIYSDKISIRALDIKSNKVYFAGDKNRVGVVDLKTKQSKEKYLYHEGLQYEFRSIEVLKDSLIVASVGNPGVFFKVDNSLNYEDKERVVYYEKNEKVFYDSMKFWNEHEGIAMGDPIENCLCILITKDGGNTWKKISCNLLPKVEDGEAAFAASNTNIILKGNKTWIVSGGKKARVFFSPDKGQTWEVFETPITQGMSTTGIYTADFYNENNGIIAGGDYTKPDGMTANKATTKDSGKRWKLVSDGTGFGYASCVQYFPSGGGKKLLEVGGNGVFLSVDGGKNWKKVADDTSLYTIKFLNESTAICAGNNKILRFRFSNL